MYRVLAPRVLAATCLPVRELGFLTQFPEKKLRHREVMRPDQAPAAAQWEGQRGTHGSWRLGCEGPDAPQGLMAVLEFTLIISGSASVSPVNRFLVF